MIPEFGGNSDDRIFLLYVDDETILLNVTKQYLEYTGNFLLNTASSVKEALHMIQEEKYDAVISDYQMPEMDGLEFLKTLRTEGNSIPFILFTGRGREEVAIEAFNAGADYYLQKGGKPNVQFGELQNCVRQVVYKTRAEKRLLEYERKMADVINFMPDATFAVKMDGRVIAWNRAIEQMTGTPASEMLGKGDYEYALPFYGKRRPIMIDLVLNESLQTEVSYPVLNRENRDRLYAETFIPHLRNGEGAYLWFTASPLYDTDGRVTGAIESIRDITDYKQAEGIYRTVFENTGTAMAIVEDEVTILHVNEKMKLLMGYSGDEPGMFLNWQERVAEEDRERVLEYHRLRRTEPDSVPNSYDCRLIHRTGEIIDVKLTSAMIPGTKKNIISFIDITGQKEAETKLKFTQFTMDNGPDAIFWVDFNGDFISVNKKATDIFGYSEEELRGMGLSMFIPNFQQENFLDFWNKHDRNSAFIFEVKSSKKDGEDVSTEISVVNLNYDGQKYGCAFVRDISERKRVEAAQRESEIKFREIFNSASDVIFLNEFIPGTGPGRFIEVNDATCRNLGYTREELLRMSMADILLPEIRDHFDDIVKQYRAKGRASFEGRAITKDGSIITFDTCGTIFQLNNRMVHLSVGRDVSERKKAEQTLRESETKFREIFNSTGDIIFLNEFPPRGPPGRFLEVNDAACRSLGYSRDEMLQMSMVDIEGAETRDHYLNIANQFRTKGRATFEAKAIRKDGTIATIENNSCCFALNNRVVHLSVGRDITERKNTENALKTLNKKLNLLSSITRHDINNQISVLLGYEEMLKGEDDKGKADDYLGKIIGATEMIESQIAFTREYQELGVHSPTWQSVENSASLAVSNMSSTAVNVRIDTGTLEIFTDQMLEKVFYNIFENAVRHGKHVTDIHVSFHETGGSGVLTIEDNGIGIADDMKKKIFDRGVGSNTGFGLFLSREILDITDISISETGTDGKGARFEIAVPKYGYRYND
ncbi:PAS domain S-box protein [Methanogenium sp. S4BF]|uniref:PAS domain S-box protein n=1 Tax=Methanogenium sp. S4BF TaxID=1789226 RepID=UPI002417EFD1|nr:PAS domain S-box protein [Methanogenium sp. S4BF]WFN35633.1 PAS domain S-box protein [Methanogenium sp. S4BF]